MRSKITKTPEKKKRDLRRGPPTSLRNTDRKSSLQEPSGETENGPGLARPDWQHEHTEGQNTHE